MVADGGGRSSLPLFVHVLVKLYLAAEDTATRGDFLAAEGTNDIECGRENQLLHSLTLLIDHSIEGGCCLKPEPDDSNVNVHFKLT